MSYLPNHLFARLEQRSAFLSLPDHRKLPSRNIFQDDVRILVRVSSATMGGCGCKKPKIHSQIQKHRYEQTIVACIWLIQSRFGEFVFDCSVRERYFNHSGGALWLLTFHTSGVMSWLQLVKRIILWRLSHYGYLYMHVCIINCWTIGMWPRSCTFLFDNRCFNIVITTEFTIA